MRQGTRSATGLLVACALLAGCSGDGDGAATTLPPITASPTGGATGEDSPTSPSTAPSTTGPAPTTSADLGDDHVEVVESTMLAYLTALNTAKSSGDFSAFDALYTGACTGCLDMRAEVEAWLADGHTVEGGDWIVMQQSSLLRNQGTRADNYFLMYRTAVSVYAGDSQSVLDIPQSEIQFGSAGLVDSGGWMVDAIGYRDFTE